MPELVVQTGQVQHAPGDPIDVAVIWDLDAPPESVAVRLLWQTSGRGDRDVALVSEQIVQAPATDGSSAHTFVAPAAPPSFSGTLITLQWVIEAEVRPQGLVAHTDIVIGPDGDEVRI